MRKIFLICILPVVTLVISCKKDTTGISNTIPNSPDTTSHNFEWTADTIFAADAWQVSLYDIWGTDENNVWAVGHSDDSDYQIWHWNGENWNNINPNILGYRPSYYEIYGFAEDDFWIVGDGAHVIGDSIDSKAYILRYDGAWRRWDNNDLSTECSSVWGTSSENIYFGFHKGLIIKYDGINLIRYEFEKDVHFRCIWGVNDSTIYALANKMVINPGSSFSIAMLYKYQDNNFVLFDSAAHYNKGFGMDLWGYNENIFYSAMNGIYKYINNQWINEFYSTTIYCVFGSVPNNVFAGGYQNTFYHYNGDNWKQLNFGDNSSGTIFSIWCKDDYVFVIERIGNYSRILRGRQINK